MNILVLKPRPHQLDWTLFANGRRAPMLTGHAGGCRGAAESRETFHTVIDLAVSSLGTAATLDAVAVRLPFGGASGAVGCAMNDDCWSGLGEALNAYSDWIVASKAAAKKKAAPKDGEKDEAAG